MSIIQNIIISIFLRKQKKLYNDSLKIQWLSREKIYELQENKLKQLIAFLEINNKYYKSVGISKIRSFQEISKLPFLTKGIIQKNFETLKSKNIKKNRFVYNSTSGSTGETLKFFSDRKKKRYAFACIRRGNSWTGWNPYEKRISLWGANRDIKTNLIFRLLNSRYILNLLMLSSFDMTNEDIAIYTDIINKKKPSLIIGYPSTLTVFAEYLQNNKINIWSPKGIITGGETLYEFQRSIIQKSFNCNVLNRYSCREVHHIANECEMQNGLHISSDHVFVEIIDEYGNPCKSGQLGEIVVTDLDNYVFPLIRYKTGDLGMLEYEDKQCKCGRGFPLLRKVEGRTFDLVVGANGNRIPGNFFTLILRYKVKGIKQFQIIQKEIGKINLKVVISEEYNENEKVKIKRLIKEKVGNSTKINMEIVNKIDCTISGKHRWIISEVSPFIK